MADPLDRNLIDDGKSGGPILMPLALAQARSDPLSAASVDRGQAIRQA